MRFQRLLFGGLMFALMGGLPAWGNLIITPTFGSMITSDPNAAAIEGVINTAIQAYETTFTNPINVTIDFNEMSSGLGQSNDTLYTLSYSQFYTAFQKVATNSGQADQLTALAHLPSGPNNPVTGSSTIDIKTANIRALGIAGSFPPIGGFDGTINLNTHITDVGSPGTSGQYSLLATTEHEIDEVLGLGSDLPSITSIPSPEDLYRYSSAGVRTFTTSAGQAFFSIDGTHMLAQFDNQNDGGDFGDWQSSPLPNGVQPQVQDAFATPGSHPTLGINELTALDAIGYVEAQGALAPEPSTLLLLGCGAVVTGLLKRRHSRV